MKVIIANTETKGPLGDSHLGEVMLHQHRHRHRLLPGLQVGFQQAVRVVLHVQVWVSSPHNATGYYTVYGEEALHADHFSTKLSFGDTQTVWARTGYLGFLRRTELTDASGGEKAKILIFLFVFEPIRVLLHQHTMPDLHLSSSCLTPPPSPQMALISPVRSAQNKSDRMSDLISESLL